MPWCLLAAVLAIVKGEPCDGAVKSFEPKKGKRASCACRGLEGQRVTSLLNSADDEVTTWALTPDMPRPGRMMFAQQLQYWKLQIGLEDLNLSLSCPRNWSDIREGLPPVVAGSYLFAPDFRALSQLELPIEVNRAWDHCRISRQCPHGFYCEPSKVGDSLHWQEPKACPKGKLCDQMNLSTPLPCPEGYFCPTSLLKQECVLGFHCPEDTYVPKLCAKGYYCHTPCNQTKCPEGNWCPEGSHQPIACPWWSKCPEGSESENWWALGLTMAIGLPLLFELALERGFCLQVHEQTAVPVPRGMTLPCALLMLSTLVVAWFVMPYVALIETSVLVYALTGLTNTKILSGVRSLIVLGLAYLAYVHGGFLSATWTLYIPGYIFVGFLCNSPLAASRRRGLTGLLALSSSQILANGGLLPAVGVMNIGVKVQVYATLIRYVFYFLAFPMWLIYLARAEIRREILPTSDGHDRMPGMSFQLENVGLIVGTSPKAVLEDISLTINGDTSCALMGPSGSGKSSLLNVLTGRALLYGEVSGRLFANGELIPEGIEAKCKNATGFVPQDDVMHTDLTVYENVYFSARLRLPPDTKAQDVVDTVEQVLKDVGIWHVKDTPVGNADLRGISGGQRKRASIAMELVGRPSVLFLDEPTSGLDASAAHSIITLICDKSQLRCTSIAVIHQPRWKTLACFDQVVLLATGGYLVYSGPVPDSVAYFTQSLNLKVSEGDNPADLFLDFIGGEALRSPEDLAREWTSYQPVTRHSSDRPSPPLSAYEKSRPGVAETFWILYLRCSLQVCRIRSLRLTNLCLVAFFLLLMRALLGEGGDFEDVLMRLGIGQSMLMLPVCIHGLHVFNCDRLERQREDIAGIPTLSQYLAKDFCHLVELMLFAAVWTGVYGPYSHLGISPWLMLRVAVGQAYLAFGISHLLSVNMPSQSTATVTVILFLVVAQLCSGVDMISLKDMRSAFLGAGWLIFILSPSFYTVQRFLPILLNQGMTPPVRDAVCKGYLQQKGVACEWRFEGFPNPTLHFTTFFEYIFLSSDVQLVMLGIAARGMSILQLQLRAVGLKGRLWELFLRRVVLFNAALFYVLTISQTYNERSAAQ